ncbi:MAG: glycosyltransferase family 4 protein [Promethearchaeota archaeon]
MEKLKICLISLKFPPDDKDGEAQVFREYYDFLRSKGHNVTVITGKWKKKLKDPNIIQINIIRKRFLWIPQFNFKVALFLIKNKSNFDIIHGNGPKGTFPIILANVKKFISTIHDLGHFETNFYKIPIAKILLRYIAKRSTYITTVSEFVKKEFKYFIPQVDNNKIFNFFNGIDKKFKPYPNEAMKLRNKLNIEGPVLLYIGRIAPYKGVEYIIKAFQIAKAEIPNLNLVIGGLPDYSMEKSYYQWKNSYKDIRFVGFISDEELAFYYSMGDVFITYSHASEGFGLTSIEAIACGTPVICSSIMVFREILQDNAIFVPPKNSKLLAEEIINLLKNKELRESLISKSHNYIQKYRWDIIGNKLEKLYFQFKKL